MLSPTEGITQVTTAGNCSDVFTLTSSNPSCILTLNISENASNSTLHSAPTVCKQGPNGQVSSSQCYQPSPADIIQTIPQTRQQMAYIPNGFNETLSICPINANGMLGTCAVSDGNGTFSFPNTISINPENTYAYISSAGNHDLSICPLNFDGSLGVCAVDNAGGTLNFSPGSRTALFMTSTTGYGYIPNIGNNTISICSILSDGSLDACYAVTGNNTFDEPGSVSLVPV